MFQASLFSPTTNLKDIGLNRYEMLMEPLHDISNHNKSLLTELPHHFDTEACKDWKAFIDAAFEGKDSKRAFDYRLVMIRTAALCRERYPSCPLTEIFNTMCKIQEILYTSEDNRTDQIILQLYITILNHVMLLKTHIEHTLKVLKSRKFFGKYYHSLASHTPDQLRIVPEEQQTQKRKNYSLIFIKNVTNETSNHHSDHVIWNAIIRLQAKMKIEKDNSTTTIESQISKSPFQRFLEFIHQLQNH